MHLMYLSVVGVFVVLIRELYVLIIRITMEARDADFMTLNRVGRSGEFLPGPYTKILRISESENSENLRI